jgi:cytochrome c oxidase subunit 2
LDRNDPASADDVVSKNDLHLINHRPTVIEISAKDVIHGFAVHHMRIQQDAIPGSNIPMWFRPIKSGSYEIVCAQLCGAGHYAMKAMMTVEGQDEFDAWYKDLASLQHPATAAPAAAPAASPAPLEGAPAAAAPQAAPPAPTAPSAP